MNYRHAFHAGNFADVFKHTLLIGLIESLKLKPAPFRYVDTHAGRGSYDLRGSEAERTREYFDGAQRVLAADGLPPALQRYVDLLRSFNSGDAGDTLERYPGSPLIASRLLRADDRASVCELQADEVAALRLALRGDTRFSIHQRDGYEALKALLPPAQKRGLVLIDPPFEAQGEEYLVIQDALGNALARWPNAIIAIWYPIKQRETVAPFHRWLRENSASADVLVAELLLHPDNSGLRLNGCGMAILNPPWRFEQETGAWLPALGTVLAQGRYGSTRIDWLKTT